MALVTDVVLHDEEASTEDVEQVAAVLRELRLDTAVRLPKWRLEPERPAEVPQVKPPGVGNGPGWIIEIILGLSAYEFLKAFAGELGKSSAEALKSLVRKLREARRNSPHGDSGLVLVQAPDQTELVLRSDLPREAFEKLQEVDWSACRSGTLQWDEERWYDLKRRMAEECRICPLPERRQVEDPVLNQGLSLMGATDWLQGRGYGS